MKGHFIKHTLEAREKMRASHLGQPSGMKGKHASQETRKKQSVSQKKRFEVQTVWNKGLKRPYLDEVIIKMSEGQRRRFKNSSSWNKGRKGWTFGTKAGFKKGVLNPAWDNWKSFEPYGVEFNVNLREYIRFRDKYSCQECGLTQNGLGYTLSVHHIDYNKRNNNPNNLITLCKVCHAKTNWGREDWVEHYHLKNTQAHIDFTKTDMFKSLPEQVKQMFADHIQGELGAHMGGQSEQ